MKLGSPTTATPHALAPVSVFAETIEVQMLNQGEAGTIVFEPRFVSALVGDIVVFRAADKGHNAETVKGVVPGGQAPFVGKINEEVELTSDGMIGVKFKPHLGMGMVMVMEDGALAMQDGFLNAKLPKKACEEIISESMS
ncbi:plastocyanin/azurin family copper-binding protein [Ruegeria arenilitoris]|uniref:plastocyanin/azurin family copper-binding protein n=1 Tax=Ruegeria arenilitoris TaxID=1173585 RepID=UPI00147A7BD1|nr:plastocyanin/azurin family copper-binding protein [Ruegeria arenilitoris]